MVATVLGRTEEAEQLSAADHAQKCGAGAGLVCGGLVRIGCGQAEPVHDHSWPRSRLELQAGQVPQPRATAIGGHHQVGPPDLAIFQSHPLHHAIGPHQKPVHRQSHLHAHALELAASLHQGRQQGVLGHQGAGQGATPGFSGEEQALSIHLHAPTGEGAAGDAVEKLGQSHRLEGLEAAGHQGLPPEGGPVGVGWISALLIEQAHPQA